MNRRLIFIVIPAVILGCAKTKAPSIEHPFYPNLIATDNVVLAYHQTLQEWSGPMRIQRKLIRSKHLPGAIEENVWKILSLIINGVHQPQRVTLDIASQPVEVEITGSRTIDGRIETTVFDVTTVGENPPVKLIRWRVTYWWNSKRIEDDFLSVWAPSEIRAVYTVQRTDEAQQVVERSLYEEWHLERILPVHDVVQRPN